MTVPAEPDIESLLAEKRYDELVASVTKEIWKLVEADEVWPAVQLAIDTAPALIDRQQSRHAAEVCTLALDVAPRNSKTPMRRIAKAARLRGRAYFDLGNLLAAESDLRTATSLLDQYAQLPRAHNVSEDRFEAAIDHATILSLLGKSAESDAVLDGAGDRLSPAAEHRRMCARAINLCVRARFRQALATLRSAAELADQVGERAQVQVAIERAIIALKSGHAAGAQQLLQGEIDSGRADRHIVLAATARVNLAAAQQTLGDFGPARTNLETARRNFDEINAARGACEAMLNLAVCHAEPHLYDVISLEQVRQQFIDLGLEAAAATSGANLGLAFAARGQLKEASAALVQAQSAFIRLGQPEAAARSTVDHVDVMLRAGQSDFQSACEQLLPALVYLDSVRFQFRAAQDRLAWKSTTFRATRVAFEAADRAGDASLIAQLVEMSINSGVYTASVQSSSDDSADLAEELQCTDAVTTSALSPVRLIAGAALPIAAPPRLRMPGGKIAFEEHFGTARARYGEGHALFDFGNQVIDVCPDWLV